VSQDCPKPIWDRQIADNNTLTGFSTGIFARV